MPKQATCDLYTDKNPVGTEKGRVITDPSDRSAAFQLTGKGGILSDAEVKRLGLEGCEYLVDYDPEKAAANREAEVQASYKGTASIAISPPEPLPVVQAGEVEPAEEPEVPSPKSKKVSK